MDKKLIPLSQLPVGSFGKVVKLNADGNLRRRLQDLGLIYDTTIESVRKSPAGDPIAYQIRGAIIALREDEAATILIESL